MKGTENLECPECWGTIPHPGDANCISDARVEVLHKLAHAMMVVELQKHFGTLDDALRVPAEAQRTYKRLLSSREAMKLLAQIEMCGLCLVDKPKEFKPPCGQGCSEPGQDGCCMRHPFKFDNVFCSNCGRTFGPGDHGFSHCENHKGMAGTR